MSSSTDVRYFNWDGDVGTGPLTSRSGDELYYPFTVGIYGRPNDNWNIELVGRGGWVRARQNSPGLEGEVETFTDSAFGGTVTYYGLNGIQPFISLNMNLPTGDPTLFGTDVNAQMNPNLVDIATFGEGLNTGPSVGANIPLSQALMLTVSVGYTWRGEYDQSSLFQASRIPLVVFDGVITPIDPGDVGTVTATLGYAKGQIYVSGSASYSQDTETTQRGKRLSGPSGFDNCVQAPVNTNLPPTCDTVTQQLSSNNTWEPLFDGGDRFFVSGYLAYDWSKAGRTAVDGSISVSGKNKQTFLANTLELTLTGQDQDSEDPLIGSTLFFSDTRFGEEPFNSNSDFFRVGLEHLFPASQLFPNLGFTKNWWFGPTGSWLHRTENDYPVGTVQFVSEATRWAAGAILRHTGPKLTLTARLDHVWLEQDPIPAPGGVLTNLLSSTSCADATPVPVNNEPDGATNTCAANGVRPGTHQDSFAAASRPASSFRDWQASIGVSLNF
jgi:hypothetical protein